LEQQEERRTIKGGGDLIFARLKEEVKLTDFIIRKMIGKGTFGKVYLVQHNKNEKIFAMKCIRKDIIIDNEQFENIKLEKDILFNIEHPFIVNMEYVFQNEFRIYFLMNFIK
jgi:serine/threonine protein kinase